MNGVTYPRSYPTNCMNNQKYNLFSFLPKVLYNEFKMFFNMFFLVIALSQFIPFLKVGLLVTYIAPLIFVLAVTMLKEAYDDILRLMRDRELNSTKYGVVLPSKKVDTICAQDIKVGSIIRIKQNDRVPADVLLLWKANNDEPTFIKTDQLDGETDWKLRKPLFPLDQLPETAGMKHAIVQIDGMIECTPPNDELYEFKGFFSHGKDNKKAPLDVNNTMW